MLRLILQLLFLCISITAKSQNGMFDICPLKNAEKIPDAMVFNIKGEELNLNEYIGQRPVVVVFYRGGWCGYCTQHLSALQEVKTQIDSLGFELIAITPDDFIHLDSSIVRSDGLDYQLFSDKNIQAIEAFGIGWQVSDQLFNKYKDRYDLDLSWWSSAIHHILPVPAVFVINKGIIQHQYINPDYSKRLSLIVLLSFLKDT